MLLGIITDGTSEPIFGVNFTCIIKYNDNDGWTVKFTTLMMKGTDCTGSCKSNYHTITTTTVPRRDIKCFEYKYTTCIYLYKFYMISPLPYQLFRSQS
jgi:hypothetical protein